MTKTPAAADANTAEILEQSLYAVAETGEDITPHFFKRLFDRHPEQQAFFFHPDSTCGTMVNEMIELLMALAAGQQWVEGSTQSLVISHRCFADIDLPLYAESLDLLIDTMANLAAEQWTPQFDEAWRMQATRLNAIIAKSC